MITLVALGVLAAAQGKPVSQPRFESRILTREGLPYEGRQSAAHGLVYLIEKGHSLFGIDGDGVVRAKTDVATSPDSKVHGVYPAHGGDVYVVVRELRPLEGFEKFEPNQKIAVLRYSADLKKRRWKNEKTLPNVSELYGCSAAVDKQGSITLALGVPQLAYRLKPDGKEAWTSKLPPKLAVHGLHVGDDGVTRIGLAPTIFEGDGVESHRLAVVEVSAAGAVSAPKLVGQAFREVRGRTQAGSKLFFSLGSGKGFRFSCLDLSKSDIKWSRFEEGPTTDPRITGNDSGEAAVAIRVDKEFKLLGIRSDGNIRFETKRAELVQSLAYTRDGLVVLYDTTKHEQPQTVIDFIGGYGRVVDSYGVACRGGTLVVRQMDDGYLITNLTVMTSTNTERQSGIRAMPVLWLLEPIK